VEDQPVVFEYAHPDHGPATGLRPGDVLLSMDGTSVDSVIAAVAPYYGASNEAARMRDIARNLTRGALGSVAVTIDRAGEALDFVVERIPWGQVRLAGVRSAHRRPEALQLLSDDVAYLNLSTVKQRDIRGYVHALEGINTLIVDLRDPPGNSLVFALGEHLVTERTDFARATRGVTSLPGAFVWADPEVLKPGGPVFPGNVIILINEQSQSRTEYLAMALGSSPNAFLVGSPTAGANGNMSEIPLPGGISAWMSGVGVYFPDGTPVQRKGIIPDLLVRPTIEGIRAGRDEVLEAARACAVHPNRGGRPEPAVE